MASDGHKQPLWIPPQTRPDIQMPQLKIYNSLTRSKDDFVPIDPTGKTVTWYACGPTVYEDAHLGHAKNYVSTDIIRRIMNDYFGFHVKFVMNTTDIDDKIILKARQRHLLAEFQLKHAIEDNSISNSVLAETKAAFRQYVDKYLPSLPSNTEPETFLEAVTKTYKQDTGALLSADAMMVEQGQTTTVADMLLRAHVATARSAIEALLTPGTLSQFLAKTEDILLPYLDALHGAEIDFRDHEIFLELTRNFERRFFEDMSALNVLLPDQLTRVTEYVPHVVDFVEKIVANGFGYPAPDGSVYFDIDSFEKAGHSYSRLEPWNKSDRDLQADGEGSLSWGMSMKRKEIDFALWKASKPGEPAWPSPWGHGRPGWHIECSAMASEVLGKTIDIHSGGVDLRFPHHDNELAQSEAYWSTPGRESQWVNYFIHMGQLRIRGLKMSKSLKNYTTIRSVLSEGAWSARSLRICFLLVPWQDGVEVTDELMKAVVNWEGKLNNFFLKSLDVWKHSTEITTTQELSITDQDMLYRMEKAEADVDSALRDSFDTSSVMKILSDLVTEYNSTQDLSNQTILALARWITRIVTIFGLDIEGNLSNSTRIGWSGLDIPASAKPYIYPASQLRDQIRTLARTGSIDHETAAKLADRVSIEGPTPVSESPNPYHQVLQQFRTNIKTLAAQKSPAKDFLALCDELRDTHLWDLGIYLEDRNGSQPALIRPLDRLLITSRAEREATSATKAKARSEREAGEAERARQLRERAKIDPGVMFRNLKEYSEWDERGIPIADAQGNALSNGRRRKLTREWEGQRKRYEGWRTMGQWS